MKLCMIGVRGHNGYVFEGLKERPDVKVVGVAAGAEGDDAAGLADACRKRGDDPAVHAEWRAMLDALKPDIVSVAGPFEQHAEMSIEAMRRGAHVFCEKPVALTLPDLAKLRRAHAKAGVHLAGMMGIRYMPAFHAAWKAVREGGIGTVRMISTRKSYRCGERPDYYKRRATYGGTIPWVGSHSIDWIRWFSDRKFKSVYAVQSTAYNRGNGEMEMSAMCQFTLEDDIFGQCSIDYLRPANAPTHGDDRVRVAGTDGVVEVRAGAAYLINAAAAGERTLDAKCDRTIFGDFIAAAAGGAGSLLGPEDTFAVTEACLRAQRSADTGRVVAFG